MPASRASWLETIAEARKLLDLHREQLPDYPTRVLSLNLAKDVGEAPLGVILYEAAIEDLEWPEEAAPPRTDEGMSGRYVGKLVDAYTAGEEKGKAAGSWLLDGNSTTEDALALLQKVMDCELDVPAPLSGEWADGLTIGDVLGDLDIPLDHEDADAILQAWEDGYSAGYQEEAERLARFYSEPVD